MSNTENKESLNFLEQIIEKDLAEGKYDKIITRFPPEPNGYLHIGHAKSICLNFGLTQDRPGYTNLRFDDTNPVTEETEYVESIMKDIKWLGFEWEGDAKFASDYFQDLYDFAVNLIKQGLAYVDDSTAEEIAEQKGTPTRPGTGNKFRERSVAENLDLFERMKNGEFEDGEKVLRAKVDMTSPNMLMRDPLIYRIKKATHHRTGDDWCIYPMYDFAHGQSDSVEEISHSVCTLEFENHRPLYNWFIEKLGIYPSRQYEFARLNVKYMITSKRKLLKLVTEGHVTGWDDPRMPTISGMRRRGYTPASIRHFCKKIGVARRENLIEMSELEHSVRQDLNKVADRAMVVLDPVKVVITNYPEGQSEDLIAINNQEDENSGTHTVPFGREIYIERSDFKKEPQNRKYFRLAPDKDVRLKYAYIIHCEGFKEDKNGNVTEIHCTYYKDSKSGEDTSGVKAKGTLHWVSAEHAKPVEVREYDRLFSDENPTGHEGVDYLEFLNPDNLKVIEGALAEPWLLEAEVGHHFQFLRKGYYAVDQDSTDDKMVLNRTVTLKDSWGKKFK